MSDIAIALPLRKTKWRRAPTSGGQYHWVAQLAPTRFARTFSWAAGTMNLLRSLRRSCTHIARLGLHFRTSICLREYGLCSGSDDPRAIDPEPRELRATTMAWNNALLAGTPDCRSGEYPRYQGIPAY